MIKEQQLENLLRANLPRDENRATGDRMVAAWAHELKSATTVVLSWIDTYGPKFQALWLDQYGNVLTSIARPPARADEVRAFVFDWERLMRMHHHPVQVIWRDEAAQQTGALLRAHTLDSLLRAIASGEPVEVTVESDVKPSTIRSRIRRASAALGLEAPRTQQQGNRIILRPRSLQSGPRRRLPQEREDLTKIG